MAREKESAAIRNLKESAAEAQERVLSSAEEARLIVQKACETALSELSIASQASQANSDKRNINGSFQWDRADKYGSGSDGKIQRLEDKINGIGKEKVSLEIGAAQRVEQIIGIRTEIKGLHDELDTKKSEIEHLANELVTDMKELSNRLNIQHDLIIETRDMCTVRIDANRDETQKDKIKNQQYVIGIVVGMIVLFFTSVAFGYLRI